MNRYESNIESLFDKLKSFKSLQTNSQGSIQDLGLNPNLRELFQELVQICKDKKFGSYTMHHKTSEQIDESAYKPKLLELINEFSKPNNPYSLDKEAEWPNYALSERVEMKNLHHRFSSIKLFGVQTDSNKIEIIKFLGIPAYKADELSAGPKEEKIHSSYQLVTVIFEGYSTRETSILGFDFLKQETEESKSDLIRNPNMWLVVATADGSISKVDVNLRNVILGHDALTVIKFDVDIAYKVSFPIKKDFRRMRCTNLEVIKNKSEEITDQDQKEKKEKKEVNKLEVCLRYKETIHTEGEMNKMVMDPKDYFGKI